MRLWLSALLFAVMASCSMAPAMAQQCAPVVAETFIAQGVEAIARGEIKGVVLQGVKAAEFGTEGGLSAPLVAVFLITDADGSPVLVLVMAQGDSAVACIGPPNPQARDLIRKHIGQGA